jgi:GNAT superfamily N-acetyltransferase
MVEYRLINYDKDRKDVIKLLNQNLTPRNTEQFFNWKYLNSPCGSSTGTVAVTDNKIVAVVFYLPFNFYSNKKIMKAARPVGGCTDPAYRGKGIFKKLMKFCLESYDKDYAFLFANPNRFSRPEFKKMGWKELGGYEYHVGLVIPRVRQNLNFSSLSNESKSDKLYFSHNDYVSAGTTEFINWRYADNRYTVKKFRTTNYENYLVYRVSKIKNIKSLILCDYCGDEFYLDSAIKKACRIEGTLLVYFLANETTAKIRFALTKKHQKVVVTYTEKEPDVIKNVRFSLGDLEGTV